MFLETSEASEVEDEKGHVSENEYDGGESDEDVGEPR